MKISYEVAARGQEEYLLALAPAEVLSRIGQDNTCIIAAVRENEDGSREPVGLILFEEEANGARRVNRLFVAENARGNDIADRLLTYYREDENAPALWLVEGSMLLKHRFFARAERDREKLRDVRRFSEYGRRELSSAITALAPGRVDVLAEADEEVSLIRMKDDRPQGVLALAREPGVYRILLFEAVNRRSQMRLLEAACLMLLDGEEVWLAMDEAVPKASDWMEKIFRLRSEDALLRVVCE